MPAAAVILALLVGCSRTPAHQATTYITSSTADVFPVAQRHPLPALVGSTVAGRTLDVRHLVGHGVLVVNVWASWCQNCRAESAVLASAARRHEATFVGIDVQDSPDRARQALDRAGIRYPQLRDPDGALLGKLTLLPRAGVPSTLVVDRHGLMAGRVIGAVTSAQLQQLVRAVSRKS